MSTTPQDARQIVQDLTLAAGEPNAEVVARMQYTLEASGYAVADVPAIAAGALVLLTMFVGLVDELREARVVEPMTAEAMALLTREFIAAACAVASPEVARV